MMLIRYSPWLLAALLTQGCDQLPLLDSGKVPPAAGTHQTDGPPDNPPDPGTIPEISPQPEGPARYGNRPYYQVLGKRYEVMSSAKGYEEKGIASWYGRKFHGRLTANGETYDMLKISAAHKSLPLPTYVEVTNLRNGRSLIVRVNDRGPFVDNRLIDLSWAAAAKLDVVRHGTAPVRIRALDPVDPAAPVKSTGEQGPFYLQVGAFGKSENAQRLRSKLSRNDLPVFIIQPGSHSELYRVRVGPLDDHAEVRQVGEQLKSLNVHTLQVVKQGES